MPVAELSSLEKKLDCIGTEDVSINVCRGTELYSEITDMLKRREEISRLKCMVAF